MSRVRIAHVTRLRAGFGILKQSGTAEFFVSRLQRRKIPFFMTIECSQSVYSIVYCKAMIQSPCIHETLGAAAIIQERERGVSDMGIIGNVKEEVRLIRERDPAIHSSMEVFLYPSFRAMLHYRVAHKLYLSGHYFLARWISQRAVRKTGIEIHPGAKIGKGFFIDHGNGVIIGETAEIGNNVTLYQGVTLGGTGKEQGKRHPTVKDNVMISAGAKVLGSFTIGENSKIGAGSVVLSAVPPNSTVVGVPGRVVRRYNQPLPRETLDQVHLPDPVREDIMTLQKANSELINRVLELEVEVKRLEKEKASKNNTKGNEKQHEDL